MMTTTTMPLHIIQLLCPKRHCIIATVYEIEPGVDDAIALSRFREQWIAMTTTGGYNPWCGICGSHDLTFETANTRWDTLEEARPFLRDEQLNNAITRAQIDDAKERRN